MNLHVQPVVTNSRNVSGMVQRYEINTLIHFLSEGEIRKSKEEKKKNKMPIISAEAH